MKCSFSIRLMEYLVCSLDVMICYRPPAPESGRLVLTKSSLDGTDCAAGRRVCQCYVKKTERESKARRERRGMRSNIL